MQKLKFASSYKEGKSKQFPDEDALTQSQRNQKDYFLSCAQAIISKFCNNRCATPYDSYSEGQRSFAELRAYRYGRNSPNKYKDVLIGKAQQDGTRKTTVNISWDILQILPQKMDVVIGYLQKVNYDVVTEATDYQAQMSKKQMVAMAKIVSDERMSMLSEDTNQAAGRPVIPTDDDSKTVGGIKFNNPKEVEMASTVGVFFLEQEAAIKVLLDKSMYDSGWDGISDKLKDDFCTIGIAITMAETNQNTNIVEDDYVDPDLAIVPYSTYHDHRDMSWGGRIKQVTIAELRRKLKIDEKELVQIAKMYSSENTSGIQTNFYGQIYADRQNNNGFGMNMMDQILVDVADVRWIGKKSVKVTSVNRDKDGVFIVNKVDDDYKLSDREAKKGKNLDEYTNCTVYKAKLVLGTSHVFDWGEDNDVSFTKNTMGRQYPVFPMTVIRTIGSSLVERCVGFVDDACLGTYKLRIARKKMPAPPNLMIKKSSLENLKIGNEIWKPSRAMKVLEDEGFLLYDDQNQWGNQNSAGSPISVIPSDTIKQLLEWRSDIEWNISMIEKVTGINDVFSAQTPQRQQGLGVSNLMVQAVDNALTPIVRSWEYIYEQTMRKTSYKWQIVSTYMTDEQRKRLSINRALQVVKIGSDLNDYDFSIRINAGLNDADKQQLLGDITNMRDAARQGGASGLNESDYLLLFNMIKKGDVKKAQIILAQILEARKKEAAQEQQQMIQSNAQAQQQSNAQTQQGNMQAIQAEGQVKAGTDMQAIQAKAQADLQIEQFKARARLNELALQNVYGANTKSA